jgi:threonine/homoserine/homoserine lactone efflux protein
MNGIISWLPGVCSRRFALLLFLLLRTFIAMLDALLKGAGLGLLLSISVGPVLFSIIKQSLTNGYRGGLSFVAGVSASDISLVFISNIFTQLFAQLKDFKTHIAVTGCIFLVTLGIYFLFFKKVQVNAEGNHLMIKFRKRDYARIFASGYLMNTLNPACILFWITWSTAFITHALDTRVVIFATCLVIVLGLDVAKVIMAGKIRNRLTPHNINIINRINGLILIGFGIALVWGLLVYGKRW